MPKRSVEIGILADLVDVFLTIARHSKKHLPDGPASILGGMGPSRENFFRRGPLLPRVRCGCLVL